jgi:hypothetical protein
VSTCVCMCVYRVTLKILIKKERRHVNMCKTGRSMCFSRVPTSVMTGLGNVHPHPSKKHGSSLSEKAEEDSKGLPLCTRLPRIS